VGAGCVGSGASGDVSGDEEENGSGSEVGAGSTSTRAEGLDADEPAVEAVPLVGSLVGSLAGVVATRGFLAEGRVRVSRPWQPERVKRRPKHNEVTVTEEKLFDFTSTSPSTEAANSKHFTTHSSQPIQLLRRLGVQEKLTVAIAT
jgi:hypothetical protein